MNRSRLIWGIILLAIAGVLVVAKPNNIGPCLLCPAGVWPINPFTY
jgi:hypothetical protein